MKSKLITAFAAGTLAVLASSTALAQRQQAPTPEQRLDRLERQIGQMQRQVYPKGRPADTAGFADDPAATQSSVLSLAQRLDALERQLADLVRQSEENGNRLRSVESGLGQLKTDQDQRMATLEQRIAAVQAAPVAAPVEVGPAPVTTASPGKKPTPPRTSPKTSAVEAPTTAGAVEAVAASDPAEDAYTSGFRLWEAGQYDQAINSLKSFTAAYPRHRRVSYANNLIGRAMLDEGDARGAASALLANYRTNPGGERAQDSLFYLGQALMKLGQPGQACKAYAELDAVYGAKVRPDVKKMEAEAKSQAQCS